MKTLKDVTIVIKTFERPESIQKLLKGIRENYRVPVIVCDDSREPRDWPGADQTIKTEHNIGLSQGRNLLIAACQTPYAILMDDDFEVTKDSNLERFLSLLKTNQVDLVGGAVNESGKDEILQAFNLDIVEGDVLQLTRPLTNLLKQNSCDFVRCDFVRNFFIMDVAKVLKLGGWDPKWKQGEHYPFFLRHQGKLKIGYTSTVKVGHQKGLGDEYYHTFRSKGREMMMQFLDEEFGIHFVIKEKQRG